jgi:hypothetical protein
VARPRASFISTKPLSTDLQPHLRRQVVLWGAPARDVQKLATREATMLLIPVVLVIGGILALVLYLEKRSPPYRE